VNPTVHNINTSPVSSVTRDTAPTHMYVEAGLTMKEQALVKLQPAGTSVRRFGAPDELMSFLQAL
jgi:integrase/recombinase XerD